MGRQNKTGEEQQQRMLSERGNVAKPGSGRAGRQAGRQSRNPEEVNQGQQATK